MVNLVSHLFIMSANASPQSHNYPFLSGGGEMGVLIRAFDWSITPLGDPGTWPAALRQSVNMLLNTSFPVLICWGRDYIQLYNDAFRPINGQTLHNRALGASAKDTYADSWDKMGPILQGVMDGTPVSFSDSPVKIHRNGYLEDGYFDFSYSPVYDEEANSLGVRVICAETTDKVKAQHELDSINRELGSTNEELASTNEELASTNDVLAATNEDLYSSNEELSSTNEELAATNEELLQTQDLLRQTLENLTESEQRFRNLVRDADVGIVLLMGPEMRVGIVNEAFGRLFKRTAAELEGKLLFEMVPPEDEAYFRPLIEGVRITGKPAYLYDAPYLVYKDGAPVSGYLNIVYQPYRESDELISGVMALCQDVTVQVEATQRLRLANEEISAKEARLQMAIATTNLGTWEYNIASGELYWSAECRDIYGIGPGELPNMAVFADHIYPEDREYVEKEIDRCIAAGSDASYDIAYRILRFDNEEIRWIKVHGKVYEGDGGAPERFIGTVLDITKQKQAEEESAKLAAIITSSDDAIISKTLESVITSWNSSAERMFGYSAGEMIGETIYKLIPHDRQNEETEIIERLRKGERVEHFETKRLTREGRLIDVSLTISPIKDRNGQIIGASKIARDITGQKQSEEESAKLAAIITSSDDAIISKTLESVITSWNSSAERMFGYSATEMIGETIYKLIPHERHNEETEIIERLRKGERMEHFETKRMTSDGRLIDVSLTISPIKDRNGQIIGASKIARDITERKLDEARKNDFIGMVSHELKTPLTSLTAILQVASAKLKSNPDSFLAGAMERANSQVKKMSAMINGFLNVSRLESGKIVLDRQEFDLYALLQDVVAEIKLTTATHPIQVGECIAMRVNGDLDKIASVVTNLVGNAIKYSPKGRPIAVHCEEKDGFVIVGVRDEGMGIPAEDLPHVFDRYFRSESQQTRHISGFGIGLYLSAEIIHRHDGKIWAESETGKGSTFYFSLPLIPAGR